MRLCRLLGAGALAATTFGLVACGEEEPEALAPPPMQQTRPVVQRDPMEGLTMDPRVEFPAQRAPATAELAQSIADLASGLASGNPDLLRSVLDPSAAAVLDTLEARGEWASSTSSVELVRVASLEGSEDEVTVGLAIQEPGGAYMLAWQGASPDGRWAFRGLAIEPLEASTAAELDGAPISALGLPSSTAELGLSIEELRERRRQEERRDDSRRRRGRGGNNIRPSFR